MAQLYVESLQASRIVLRQLSLDIQRVTIDLEEQNQIANDTTIGFKARIDAQYKSIALSEKLAKLNIDNAKTELNVANDHLLAEEKKVGEGKASNEVLNELTEAQKKYNDAIAKESLLQLQNDEKIRTIHDAETSEIIDLMIKKRESANSDKQIAEHAFQDKKLDIQFRINAAQQEIEIDRKVTKAALSEAVKYGVSQKDLNDLLIQGDDVVLANKIKNLNTLNGLGLGDEGIKEIAKIVKLAQESEN